MFWLSVITALSCGALFSAALPGLGLWPLGLALIPFFVVVAESERSGQALGLGFSFGLGFFSLYMLWLPISFAELFGQAAWVIYPPLVLLLSLFWGLVSWLSRLIGGRGTGTLWVLPALWVLLEWARTQGYFAFPWGSVGYLWVGTPLVQLADIAGVYGLSLLTLAFAALVAAPFLERERSGRFTQERAPQRWRPLLAAALIAVAAGGYSTYQLSRTLPLATEQALLIQGNTDPLTGAIGGGRSVDLYTRLTERALEDLVNTPGYVIWPEGAVLSSDLEGPAPNPDREQIASSAGVATVITGGSANIGGDRYNSVYSIAQGAQVTDRYDKLYLVPFGERWPFLERLEPLYRTVFGWFNLPLLRGTSPGDGADPLDTPEARVAAYICYESVFPQVPRQMVARGAEVLVNISNDAWFGRGRGAEQHFLMGTMRAVETRRYLLRVGNDGITAVVDPLGRVRDVLPRRVQQTLLVNYGFNDTVTPYVRFGDWLMIALGVYTLGATVTLVFSRSS
ncbi:MAG: apolipoprotein N-acyltransferase [Trueperaceae bacterium]|nr:apolipoprotein N-acyltransferase [Trueperaceae bacterium]